MRVQTQDQLLLYAALTAALASGAWFGWQSFGGSQIDRTPAGGENFSFAAYVPAAAKVPAVKPGKWAPPMAQTRGAGWIYDVFTPPEILYDEQTRQFEVTPSRELTATVAPAAPAGLELVAVKREPFRLQLVGYVGGEGNYRGTFENTLTTEVFLAGPGRQLPALDLVITDFAVRRAPVAMADGTAANQWVATAVVRDERTGRLTTLTAGEPSYTDELIAVFAVEDDDDEALHELRLGQEFKSAEHTYKIERLQLDPPTVSLTRTSSAMSQPARLSLVPRMPRGPPPSEPLN